MDKARVVYIILLSGILLRIVYDYRLRNEPEMKGESRKYIKNFDLSYMIGEIRIIWQTGYFMEK